MQTLTNVPHDMVAALETTRGHVTVCSCGWQSTPASQLHAQARWTIHVRNRTAAASCQRAEATLRVARSRCASLQAMRTQARQRRAELREKRIRLEQERLELAIKRPPSSLARAETLDRARELAGLSRTDLWCAYFALGGDLRPDSMEAVLDGRQRTSHRELNLVAVALNERFAEEGFGYPLDYWPPR